MALILTFIHGNIIATKTHESSWILFLTFAEMVPQACLWCLQLFATLQMTQQDFLSQFFTLHVSHANFLSTRSCLSSIFNSTILSLAQLSPSFFFIYPVIWIVQNFVVIWLDWVDHPICFEYKKASDRNGCRNRVKTVCNFKVRMLVSHILNNKTGI